MITIEAVRIERTPGMLGKRERTLNVATLLRLLVTPTVPERKHATLHQALVAGYTKRT